MQQWNKNVLNIENRIAENERYENNVSRTTKYLLISKKMTDNAKNGVGVAIEKSEHDDEKRSRADCWVSP